MPQSEEEARPEEEPDKRELLERQLGPVQWRDLQAHVLREAVFLVHPTIDLLACALAMADDDTATVGAWIEAGKVTRPSLRQLKIWEHQPDKMFLAVPVQPFALAQELEVEGETSTEA